MKSLHIPFRIFLLSFSFFAIKSFEAPARSNWVQPLGQDSGVVFFQGADNSQAEAANYMVGSSFISPTTREEVSSKKGITIFKNVCVDPELPEVVLASKEPMSWAQACMQPLMAVEESASRKQYESSGIQVKAHINSSANQTLSAFSIAHKKVTLGQEPDVAVFEERAKNFLLRYGNTPQIWHGTSRGAAVAFIAAALAHKKNPETLKTVKLILLEGCYGSVESDMHCITNSQVAISCANTYFSWWYSYRKNGINPFKVLKDFPHTIPTVFITSKADTRVPKEETDKLVSELVKAGHDNIYYLILENSSHGNYVTDPKDAHMYQAFCHALYKELYLPYLAEYALAGAPLVELARKNAMALKS